MALSDLQPKIFAMFSEAYSGALTMPRLVNTDFSAEVAARGATIDIPLGETPSVDQVTDFTAGITPAAAGTPAPEVSRVNLDQDKEAAFQLTAKEIREVDDGIIPSTVRSKAVSLAMSINQALMNLAPRVPYMIGTGAAAFSGNLDALRAITAQAIRQRMPVMGRSIVLAPGPFGNASTVPQLTDADRSGLPVGMNVETLGTQRGYSWFADPMIPARTATGTIKATQVNQAGGVPRGAKTFTIDSAAGTLSDGDVLTYDVDGRTYGLAVQGNVAASGGGTSVTVYNPVEVPIPDNTAFNEVSPSGVQNLVFTTDAFALAVRVLGDPLESDGGNPPVTEIEPNSGIPITMRVWQGHGLTRWSFAALYGVGMGRADRAMRYVSAA